jgi:CBS domain-containing protein
MKISKLMTQDVRTCRPDETLEAAARSMWEGDCGCLPVTDGSLRVVGMLTDRDICMAAWTRGKTLGEIRVADAMAKQVRACNPDDSLTEAQAIMAEVRVRRLPVVDADERLVGLLSLADLAREAARTRESRRARPAIEREVAGTLAAICAQLRSTD